MGRPHPQAWSASAPVVEHPPESVDSPTARLSKRLMPHHVAECRDRLASARVAEPARRPNCCWTGVVRIGESQLGTGKDRLTRCHAQLVSSLGETGVLTLVVANDPLEPVIGEELAFAHHPRLIRLDSEAEIDD